MKLFMPVTILSVLFTVTVTFIGLHYDFWEVKGGQRKKLWNKSHVFLL